VHSHFVIMFHVLTLMMMLSESKKIVCCWYIKGLILGLFEIFLPCNSVKGFFFKHNGN
jgi:hypothetical protein